MRPLVYHLIPANMQGNILYPLNVLKKQLPYVALPHLEKYQGREALLKEKIPILDCLWNDVLMFSAVHPKKIKLALRQAGHIRPPWRWYEIDARLLDKSKAAIFIPTQLALGQYSCRIDEFHPFQIEQLDGLSEVPTLTKEYYSEVKPGDPVFIFTGMPHVLFEGQVDISRANVLEV